MHLFLYVEVSPTVPATYQDDAFNSICQKARTRLPGLVVYDCDNHSEPSTVRHALGLLSQAVRAAVVVKAGAGQLASLRPLFEALWQPVAGRLVVYEGENPAADKMLGLLPPQTLLKGPAEDYIDRLVAHLDG